MHIYVKEGLKEGLAARSCLVPQRLRNKDVVWMVNTLLELLNCEVARSPTELTTCCDDQQQQVVPEFRKGVDIHCLRWIACNHLVLRPDLFGLVATHESLEVVLRQPFFFVELTHFSLSKVESSSVLYAFGHISNLASEDLTCKNNNNKNLLRPDLNDHSLWKSKITPMLFGGIFKNNCLLRTSKNVNLSPAGYHRHQFLQAI